MKRLVSVCLCLLPLSALGTITGPTSSSTGTFTLQWGEPGLPVITLEEVTSGGATIAEYGGGSAQFSKLPGTYYFNEMGCAFISGVGFTCFVVDTHQVTVTGGGANYPENALQQADYDYQIRSGDFDSNGRTDLYVERISAGPEDGSMRSYIVWNNSNGSISAAHPGTYASAAQSAPIDTIVNLLQTDINADGFADHIIERIDQVMGSGFEQELAVYAPGTEFNTSVPQGSAQVTDDFRSFFLDLARWMNDENYFDDNINATLIPIYHFGYFCSRGIWNPNIFAFRNGGNCGPYIYFGGFRTVQYGVNFSSMAATVHMNGAGHTPPESVLWEISRVAESVIGARLFGFDPSGNRRTTNWGGDDDADNRFNSYWAFVGFAMQAAADEVDTYSEHEHDYTVETPICSTSQSWCTLKNIACWGRIFHGPRKKAGYDNPAENGGEYNLSGLFGDDDPVKVGVGAAAGLPENATAQIPLENHTLYNEEMAQWPTCPQTVPDQGAGTPPAACNQVYREPYIDTDSGQIKMRTRGTGENDWDWVNQRIGPGLMDRLDEDMIEAILNDADRLCPQL